MLDLNGLKTQLAQYQAQQKSAEQLYHQCTGIIALLTQQIALVEKEVIATPDDNLPTMDSGELQDGQTEQQEPCEAPQE